MNEKEKQKSIFELIKSSGGFIAVNKEIARKIGLYEAIIYAELASKYEYFKSKDKLSDGYFFCTIDDLQDNTTLSRYQQECAIKQLKKLNLIKYKVLGIPAKRYFKVNEDEKILLKLLESPISPQFVKNSQTCLQESDKLVCEKIAGNYINTLSQRDNNKEYINIVQLNVAPDSVSSKKDNIFSRLNESYEAESIRGMLNVVNQYVDEIYKVKTSKDHPKINKALRLTFVEKLLEFERDIMLERDDLIKFLNHIIANINVEDPTIFWLTKPKVLGYWYLNFGGDYCSLQDTIYMPVEEYY